jgi:uncharacterized membrane protein
VYTRPMGFGLVAAIGSGLIAGAFFAFSSFIMRALSKLPAAQGIAAMQRINVDVITPTFMAPFVGTALVCLLLAGWSALNLRSPNGPWLLGGSLLYFLGVFGVTMVFNVPRNNELAAADPSSSEGEAIWSDFLRTWTAWNTVRTLASLAAMVCFILGLRLNP